jgi:excinuclease ABC subunit A
MTSIRVEGACENNLKNISIELPKNRLIVLTGVSGSGKSTFAFNTLYAEGQRRYISSLSNFAKQILGQKHKPRIKSIDGLTPTISIQQQTTIASNRSTVGTSSEIIDYIRLLFARIGKLHCHQCHRVVESQSRDQIIASVMTQFSGMTVNILAPLVRTKKGTHEELFRDMQRRGYIRALVNGQIQRLDCIALLTKNTKHDIDIVVDRVLIPQADSNQFMEERVRIADAIEQSIRLASGQVGVYPQQHLPRGDGGESNSEPKSTIRYYSSQSHCSDCDVNYPEVATQHLTYNHSAGQCQKCLGLGSVLCLDITTAVSNPELSIINGAINAIGPLKALNKIDRLLWVELSRTFKVSLSTPWKKLTSQQQKIIIHGSEQSTVPWPYIDSKFRIRKPGVAFKTGSIVCRVSEFRTWSRKAANIT